MLPLEGNVLASIARLGLVSIPVVVVAAGLALSLVLDRDLPSLLHKPAIPISVGGQHLGFSMDGAWLI